MSDLLTLGAAQLVREIRAESVTPLEVMDTRIERIEAVNPAINAVVCPYVFGLSPVTVTMKRPLPLRR